MEAGDGFPYNGTVLTRTATTVSTTTIPCRNANHGDTRTPQITTTPSTRTKLLVVALLMLLLAACSPADLQSGNGQNPGAAGTDTNGGDRATADELLGRCIADQVAASLGFTVEQLSENLADSTSSSRLDTDVLRIATDICELRDLAVSSDNGADPTGAAPTGTSQTGTAPTGTSQTRPRAADPEADRDAALPAWLVDAPDRFDPDNPAPGIDVDLDALWVSCGLGDPLACNRLLYESPPNGDYEAFGFSCGGRENLDCDTLLSATTTLDGPISPDTPPPGENAQLDSWWSACAQTSSQACAQLVLTAPGGSLYAYFGYSCGGRTTGDCAGLLGDDGPPPALDGLSPDDPAPGTDNYLDLLWLRCAALSASACRDLATFGPPGSDYERFALSCGWRAVTPCTRLFTELAHLR